MKNKILVFAALTIILGSTSLKAQINVGSTTAPAASAMLQVSGTSKGFLPPVMTSANRNAITSPAVGLVIFNSTTNQLEVNTGTGAAPIWNTAGTNLSNTSGSASLLPNATGTLISNLSISTSTAIKIYNFQLSGQDGCGLFFSANFAINPTGSTNTGGVAFLGGGTTSTYGFFAASNFTISSPSADVIKYSFTGPIGACGDGDNNNITTFTLTFTWTGSGAARTVSITLTNGATTGTTPRSYYGNATQIF